MDKNFTGEAGGAMKHDPEELKNKYLKGDYKSLREFSRKEGVEYSYILKNLKGLAGKKEVNAGMNEAEIKKSLLNAANAAADAVQEFFRDKHYNKHVVKYKVYENGKPAGEELAVEKLEVPDIKTFSGMVLALEKLFKSIDDSQTKKPEAKEKDGCLEDLIKAVKKSREHNDD